MRFSVVVCRIRLSISCCLVSSHCPSGCSLYQHLIWISADLLVDQYKSSFGIPWEFSRRDRSPTGYSHISTSSNRSNSKRTPSSRSCSGTREQQPPICEVIERTPCFHFDFDSTNSRRFDAERDCKRLDLLLRVWKSSGFTE